MTGLLHDFDYEMYPSIEEHPFRGNKILKERDYPKTICHAIMGHATYTGIPRDTDMARALFSVDELTGFIFAVTYVRPSRSILEVTPRSVKKKLKQRSFAASVLREDIFQSVEELEVDLTEHIQFVIDALSEKAQELGLAS
jgi:predicted hydrolase (HD superfamily)